MPPKGYKKALADNALPDSIQVQELIQEIADLKREAAERSSGDAVQAPNGNDVNAALLTFLQKGAVHTAPVDYKKSLNKTFKFTPERKAEIEAIFKGGYAEKQKNGTIKTVSFVEDKGIEWVWDKEAPSVTFRKPATIRQFDAELNMWVKAKIWVSESLHASTEDQTFKHRLKELCSVT